MKIKDPPLAAVPAAAASKHFSALGRRQEYLLVRLWNFKVFTVGFVLCNRKILAVQPAAMGWAGMTSQTRCHSSFSRQRRHCVRVPIRREKILLAWEECRRNQPHAFQHTPLNKVHAVVGHLSPVLMAKVYQHICPGKVFVGKPCCGSCITAVRTHMSSWASNRSASAP